MWCCFISIKMLDVQNGEKLDFVVQGTVSVNVTVNHRAGKGRIFPHRLHCVNGRARRIVG